MANPTAPSSENTKLSNLLNNINSGKMQLPEFQRNWTWDDERIRAILASISQNYPIGAIMLLAYGNPNIQLKYRVVEGVHAANAVPDTLILDGQQRLTSIYLSAFSQKPVNTTTVQKMPIKRLYYFDMEKCMNPYEDRFDAVLSIPEDKKVKTDFGRKVILDLSTEEFEYKNKMFPVNIIFDNTKCMKWCWKYLNYYTNDEKAKKLFYDFNDEVLQSIIGYQLPIITLGKDTPKEAVCKVFENVNTGGVPLTVFELVTAAYAIQNFDLREDWEKCKALICGAEETLRTDLFDDIDKTSFLTTITLYTSYVNKVNGRIGMVSCKKRDVLNLPYESYRANRDTVLNGFKIARSFLLNYQCVFRKRDLPYSTQIIPLAAICAYLGQSQCNKMETVRILSRWFWSGILGEMYGGANETRYANDMEDVINEVEGKPSLNRTVNAAVFSSNRLLTLQTRLSAAYKGIMALLYKKECIDFISGLTIDKIRAMEKSPDIHHIFPQRYCRDHNLPRTKWNSIVNKTPLLPESNRAISGDAPSIYLPRILSKDAQLTEAELRSRVESHFIDYDALKADDFDKYFIDRAKKLLSLIEDAMGKPVSDRGSENTINAFGASLER